MFPLQRYFSCLINCYDWQKKLLLRRGRIYAARSLVSSAHYRAILPFRLIRREGSCLLRVTRQQHFAGDCPSIESKARQNLQCIRPPVGNRQAGESRIKRPQTVHPPRRKGRRPSVWQEPRSASGQHQRQRRETEHRAGEIVIQEGAPADPHPRNQLCTIQNQHAESLTAAAAADLTPQQPQQRRQPHRTDNRPGHTRNAGLYAVGQIGIAVVPHRAQAQQPCIPATFKRMGGLQGWRGS